MARQIVSRRRQYVLFTGTASVLQHGPGADLLGFRWSMARLSILACGVLTLIVQGRHIAGLSSLGAWRADTRMREPARSASGGLALVGAGLAVTMGR